MNNSYLRTRKTVLLALFVALIIVMSVVPFIGYIPLGFMNATIIHVPVILGALLLGPKEGALLGFMFGLTSMINNSFRPNITSFVFSPFYGNEFGNGGIKSIIICFVPRILIGLAAYLVYRLVNRLVNRISKKEDSRSPVALAAAGIAGSLTNTLLVMNGIYFLFGSSYSDAKGVAADALYKVILSVILINGIPEAIVAALLVSVIGTVLLKLYPVNKK
ncbi:MAG: ECF transporter S component [Oscillospiraceae bacterium]|nr:ECF transporter S component [Oscillospiraceae bacterium]